MQKQAASGGWSCFFCKHFCKKFWLLDQYFLLWSTTGVDFKFWVGLENLRTSCEIFIEWLANKTPHWASYCTFMSRGMITLDKHPGVCLVNSEETWQRLFAKCILRIMGAEATNASAKMTNFALVWRQELTVQFT